MFTTKQILKILLGILMATIALFMNLVFLAAVIEIFTLGIIPNLFQTLIMIAYLYLVIGLIRLKKWALIAFSIIIGSALFITTTFFFTGQEESAMEGFIYAVSAMSMIVLPIAGLLAIAIKIKRLLKSKRKGSE